VNAQEIEGARRRRMLRWLRIALLVLLAAAAIVLAILWSMRVRLASDYIDAELARRGVEARYQVKRIGLGTQVFENLVIGDPRRPDAVARRVEVQIRFGLTGPQVGLITARGVRLYGRVADGRLSLGQIDRLLPPPSGLPFRLPDQRIDVADAAIALDTPAGPVALALVGRGNLADGFRGQLALAADRLRLGRCALDGPRGSVVVAIDDLRPNFRGPVAMRQLDCGAAATVERPLLALDATLAPAVDSWRGAAAFRAVGFGTGPHRLAALEGRLTFDGDAAATRGRAEISSGAASAGMVRAVRTRFAGDYSLSLRDGGVALSGRANLFGLRIEDSALADLAAALRAAEGTPLGPIGARLAGALTAAGRNNAEAEAAVRLISRGGAGSLRLSGLRVDSNSGARLRIAGGDGLGFAWPAGRLAMDGELALSGGGFPDARFSLSQGPGSALTGRGRIAPILAGGARLALGELSFAAAPDGDTGFATTLSLDGPFSGGEVRGLVLPLRGRFGPGGFVIGEGCVTAAFSALRVQTLRLAGARLPLCPVGRALLWRQGGRLQGGGELRAPSFAGRLGSSPIGIAAGRLRIGVDGFSAAALAVRLRGASGINRLDIASLDGRFGNGVVAGPYAGLSGDLANVPLLISEGGGRWQLRRGALEVAGHIQVADRQAPARFNPLTSDDFQLTLAENRIHAVGGLNHPASGTRVARVTIDHHLGSGVGRATLDISELRFAGNFQPETLTPLTVGIVSLVNGSVSGQGRIEWNARGTSSTGTFSTAGMNLAAPFGPVEGLTTTIAFTDLLGLTTASGQIAQVDLIQAGIDVYDGRIAYQLQPNYRIAIESARWPFAGGTLDLQPTILDFSRETTKYLTFRVEGLDAARFIQQMEFSNIAATGTFDGVVPMQFDEQGSGRIIDGRLTARQEGGTLSYVGELTDRDLGAYGILAFNALKSLRYSRFDLTLNGALDGEFITRINLDGIARDPALTSMPGGGGIPQMVVGRVMGQLARIPFKFNINIQGQFRSLIATARSFSDPTPLIESVLPELLRNSPTDANDVQDEESEPVR